LFEKCGRKFVLSNCMGFHNTYRSVIAVRIDTSPKMKWDGQLERIENSEILTNFVDVRKEVP